MITTSKQDLCSLPLYLSIHQYIKIPHPLITCHHKYQPTPHHSLTTVHLTSNMSWQIPTEHQKSQAIPVNQQQNPRTDINHQVRDISLRLKIQMQCMILNIINLKQNLSTIHLEINQQLTLPQVQYTENQVSNSLPRECQKSSLTSPLSIQQWLHHQKNIYHLKRGNHLTSTHTCKHTKLLTKSICLLPIIKVHMFQTIWFHTSPHKRTTCLQ